MCIWCAFLKLELFWDVFAHFGTCSFFPFCTNYRFMLSFLYVYSFCDQFHSTCYEHISHCAFFGSKFWRQICQVFQRLLVHFCHIPEDHSDESECIENLKLVQNLLSKNKLLSMNTKLGQLSKILTLRHPPKIEVSPA